MARQDKGKQVWMIGATKDGAEWRFAQQGSQ